MAFEGVVLNEASQTGKANAARPVTGGIYNEAGSSAGCQGNGGSVGRKKE